MRREGRRFVILTTGWSGERALVRLLSAGGTVGCAGTVLAQPHADAAATLVRRTRPRSGELARGAVIRPHHLWLMNALDPYQTVADLRAEGTVLITLRRRDHLACGLSRALCGPDLEVLPPRPMTVSADHVVVFAEDSRTAADWFVQVQPTDVDVVFDEDLVEANARQRTLDRIAAALGIPAWSAPPDHDLPTDARLWSLVDGADELQATLRRLVPLAGGPEVGTIS